MALESGDPFGTFVKEALAADCDIEDSGEVYEAHDVHLWLLRLVAGERPSRPCPHRA